MTSDILTGRALDEAVAKMVGWTINHNYAKPFRGASITAYTFQSPNAFHDIVLPWVREQGWDMVVAHFDDRIYATVYDANCKRVVAVKDGAAQPRDEIIARLNALVRAHEARARTGASGPPVEAMDV